MVYKDITRNIYIKWLKWKIICNVDVLIKRKFYHVIWEVNN